MSDQNLNEPIKIADDQTDPTTSDEYKEFLFEGIDDIPDDLLEEPKTEPPANQPANQAQLDVSQLTQALLELKNQNSQTNQKLIEELTSKLANLQTQPTVQQPKPPELPDTEQLKELLYNDPMNAMKPILNYWSQTELLPVLQQIMGQVNKTSILTSKQFALADPHFKLVYESYPEEVENLVKTLPAGSDVYSTACGQVGQRHFGELLAKLSQTNQTNQTANEPPKQPPKNVGVSSSGSTPGNRPKVIRKEQLEYARRQGIDPEAYARYLRDNGKL